MLVCTSTAFLLLSTGMYNTFQVVKDGGKETLVEIFSGVPGVQPSEGAQFTQAAVESVLPGWGAGFVALALFFFAFTTIMAYYYMAETNLTYLAGVKKTHPLATLLLRLGIVGMVVFGAYHNAAMAWTLGDIGVGIMAWLNIIAILILQKPALLALRDYERQKKLGLDPVFDPEALGIRNAGFWKKRG
jgi:AGCS family alanine or glycine:cation symporter